MSATNSEFISHPAPQERAPLFARSLLNMLSPGGADGLSILIFHRVLPQKDSLFPGEIDAAEFDWLLGLLKSCFNIIPLTEAVDKLRAHKLPPRAACITFDDGYADNSEIALPILQRHQLHASFFIATGFLNGGRMWNDSVIELVRRAQSGQIDARAIGLGVHPIETIAQRQAAIPALISQLKYLPLDERLAQVQRLIDLVAIDLPDDLMMTSAQLQKLHRGGMEIGGHTVNHPILARTSDAIARDEIANGKAALEDLIKQPLRLFAYPNGKPNEDYLAQHVAMVKDLKFEGAVSTSWGSAKKHADLYQLPRFTPWDRTKLRFVLRMARNLNSAANTV
jgi:peptidoglycan/xylan/chitin deacetylase (PgdA/CDA1 family)